MEKSKEQLLKESLSVLPKDIADDIMMNEGLTWAGKLFFGGIAAWLAGKALTNLPIKLKGSKKEMKTVVDAIVASKAFQREINKPNAKIDNVVRKLNLKNMNKSKFERLTGKKWPL